MPHIALVTHSLDGGVWTVTNFIAQTLRQHGGYTLDIVRLATSMSDAASVRLLSPATWRRGPQIVNAQFGNIPYRHAGAFLTEFEFQRYQPRPGLTALLNQYDLVQVVCGPPAFAVVTREVARPVVLQAATLAQVERRAAARRTPSVKRSWRALMTKISARLDVQGLALADHVFVENKWMYEFVAQQISAAKTTFGPPGTDVHRLAPAPHYAAGGHLLWVGRLNDPRKNIPLLLAAYAQFAQTVPQAPELILAGRGAWTAEYAAQAALLGVTERVRVYCNVSAEQLRDLYQSAALFVLASDEEGLGMVILEAMACGLPVISTDSVGPATSVVRGTTGVLTPVGEATALADALRALWEQPELRRQMGQAARQRVVEHFSIEAAGGVYLQKYAELLAAAPRL